MKKIALLLIIISIALIACDNQAVQNNETANNINDDDEFLLPEDMIDAVKKIVLETWNVQVIRDTNEISSQNKVQ